MLGLSSKLCREGRKTGRSGQVLFDVLLLEMKAIRPMKKAPNEPIRRKSSCQVMNGFLCSVASIDCSSSSKRCAMTVREKRSWTLLRPVSPIDASSLGDSPVNTLRMIAVHAATSATSRSHPVCSSRTVSSGPPVVAARTGRPEYIASQGTMPKCSFCGV